MQIKDKGNQQVILTIEGETLEGVDLRGADLRLAQLGKENMKGANLEGANLVGADLQGADLRGANLEHTNLRFANLRGANLEGANLRFTQLEGVKLNNAKLPDGVVVMDQMHWKVIIVHDRIQIGCQNHSIDEWVAFTNTEINKMDANALSFWMDNKQEIITAARALNASK